VVKCALDLVKQADAGATGDLVGLQATAIWLLGNLYMSAATVQTGSNTSNEM